MAVSSITIPKPIQVNIITMIGRYLLPPPTPSTRPSIASTAPKPLKTALNRRAAAITQKNMAVTLVVSSRAALMIFQLNRLYNKAAPRAPTTPIAAHSVTLVTPITSRPITQKMIARGAAAYLRERNFSPQLTLTSGGSAGPICGWILHLMPIYAI